jgi:hypothetical protein
LAATHLPTPTDIHQHLIDELSDELHCDQSLVAEIYRREVEGLERTARLPEYIPVFAARRTRERIRRGPRGR